MREEKGARKRADPIGKASGNLEKALETMEYELKAIRKWDQSFPVCC